MTRQILQVVQEFSNAGGVETVAWELARAFSRAGISNAVVTSTLAPNADTRTEIKQIAPWLSRIATRGALRYLGRAFVVPLFTLMASFSLRDRGPTVVISHGDSLVGDLLIVHAVNAASLAEKQRAGDWRWRLNPIHLWVSARDRLMIGGLRYKLFIAVSERVRDELQSYYKVPSARIKIIPNGIDLDRFRPNPLAGATIRKEFAIPSDAKLLLFVGHEFSRKGLAYAIGALSLLPEDTWLLVVGSDNPAPYRKIAGKAEGRLIFTGARKDLPAFYAAADGFVLPTNYETFSLVCIEAMACGVPVFATRVGGIEDYLADGINGCFISFDAADIAAKIEKVFADPALHQSLRHGARATAETFGWDSVAAKYIALIEQELN